MIEETIKKIIEELKKQISNLKNEKKEPLDIENLLSLSRDEITIKLAEYEIENLDDLIFNIEKYQELLTISRYVSNTLENNKIAIKKQIDNVNNKIKANNKECQDKITKLAEFLTAFVSIYEYLYSENSNINSEDLFNYFEIIKAFPLRDGLLLEIISESCKKMLSEHKEQEEVDETIEEQLMDEDNELEIEQFENILEETTRKIEENQEQAIISEPQPEIILSDYRRKAISFATGMYSRFFNAASVDNLGFSVSYCEDPTTVDELENMAKEDGMSKLIFAIIILKLTLIIKDTSLSDDEVKPSIEKLNNYIYKYNNSCIYIDKIKIKLESANNEYYERLLGMSKMGIYSANVFEINKKMCALKDYVDKTQEYISDNLIQENEYKRIEAEITSMFSELDDFINSITGQQHTSYTKIEQKTPITSFVLFGSNHEGEPYILSDLFNRTRSLVDAAAIRTSKSDQNYQYNISKLIMDLFKYSAPAAFISSDTSTENYKGKILSQICFQQSNGKPNHNKPTDMWRFRPERNSVIRFAEREIRIPNNTKLFTQVIDIIRKVVPEFEIADESNFSLIINIGIALKKTDTELYGEAINRYYNIRLKILELFYKNGKYEQKGGIGTPELKSEFTPEECAIFEEYVKSTVEVLDTMTKQDEEYNFDSLFGQGGVNRGL